MHQDVYAMLVQQGMSKVLRGRETLKTMMLDKKRWTHGKSAHAILLIMLCLDNGVLHIRF